MGSGVVGSNKDPSDDELQIEKEQKVESRSLETVCPAFPDVVWREWLGFEQSLRETSPRSRG
jgi:hypothetical protein